MSERFGNCPGCHGAGFIRVRARDGVTNEFHSLQRDCLLCSGEGMDGNAMDYVQRETDLDAAKEQPYDFG